MLSFPSKDNRGLETSLSQEMLSVCEGFIIPIFVTPTCRKRASKLGFPVLKD